MKKKIESFKEHQLYLKAMLSFFDDLCRKNGIEYTVFDGTMLGVVREKDMIEWDGDIDVAMTEVNLEKLKKVFGKYEGRYFLSYLGHFHKKRNIHEGHRCFYAKLIDTKTNSPYLGIDIFSISFLGDDYDHAKKGVKKIKKLYRNAFIGPAFHIPSFSKDNRIIKNFGIVLIHLFHPLLFLVSWIISPFYINAIQRCINEYFMFGESSKYATIEPFFGRCDVEENSLLSLGISDYKFGLISVRCINNYDEYLSKVYGNYMVLPPIEKRVPFPAALLSANYWINIDNELNELTEIVLRNRKGMDII